MDRVERIGRNEAFFREVNERVKDVNEAFSLASGTGDFICECGDSGCVARISMTLEEYRHVRSDPATFAVVPGHELPDVEEVVERDERFFVVRKHEGKPAQIARELD